MKISRSKTMQRGNEVEVERAASGSTQRGRERHVKTFQKNIGKVFARSPRRVFGTPEHSWPANIALQGMIPRDPSGPFASTTALIADGSVELVALLGNLYLNVVQTGRCSAVRSAS